MINDPLRPGRLADFTGQDDVVRELSIVLTAAKSRGEPPHHILLSGPPGLGKTTLAGVIANETGMRLTSTTAPLLEKPGDLVSLLVSLEQPTVVFVDEVHQLPRAVEETLYTAMEDGRIDLVLSEGTARAKTVTMPLVPFTLVAATTRTGLLGAPFRDRFGYIARLRPYEVPALTGIVHRSAGLLGLRLDDAAAHVIASRSRGTPRIANRLLRRVRDWSETIGTTGAGIDAAAAAAALEAFGVDQAGLDSVDREILRALCGQFGGGPVGVATLAAATGEDAVTLQDAHEPFLMRSGLLARTPRGRTATRAAYEHLGLPVPAHLDEDAGAVPGEEQLTLT